MVRQRERDYYHQLDYIPIDKGAPLFAALLYIRKIFKKDYIDSFNFSGYTVYKCN